MCICKCINFCDVMPAIAVELLFFWSYYVYIYEMCLLLINNLILKIIYVILINISFILCQAMYFITMCHSRWYVPNNYIFTPEFYELLRRTDDYSIMFELLVRFCRERYIRVYTRTTDGNIRFCKECRLIKPDRTHHCSTCNACVIKMDHHCPWVNNCIGFTNYKYFLIFVLYSAIYCTYYGGTSIEYSVKFFLEPQKLRQLQIVIATVITLIIAVTLWILLAYHLALIGKNQTTFEAMHGPNFAPAYVPSFNVRGGCQNFREQCGNNCCYWCLPVFTASGNGVDFEVIKY